MKRHEGGLQDGRLRSLAIELRRVGQVEPLDRAEGELPALQHPVLRFQKRLAVLVVATGGAPEDIRGHLRLLEEHGGVGPVQGQGRIGFQQGADDRQEHRHDNQVAVSGHHREAVEKQA